MHTNPEVLALLALGEDSATPAERDHVASCEVCSREVAELAHLAGVGRAVQGAAPLESPRAEVWERIRAEIGFDTVNGVAAPSATTRSTVAHLGDRSRPTSAHQARSKRERDAIGDPTRRASRGRRILTLAIAAAIALILGVGVGLGWSSLSRPTPTVIGEAQLDAEAPSWAGSSGEAVLERNQSGQEILRVRMSTPRPVPGFRQVWMIGRGGKAMVPVGIITGNTGEWTVPVDAETKVPDH